MKNSFLLFLFRCFLATFLVVPAFAVAGTGGHVLLTQYKRFNVIGAISFGDALPTVGSHIKTPSEGATLQYNKANGNYRVAMSNYHGLYLNLRHQGSTWYFPVSRKDGEKVRAILKNIHKCSNKWHGNPCVVQKLDGKRHITWMTRYPPDVYVHVMRVTTKPARVYMNVAAASFYANGNEATAVADFTSSKKSH